MRINTSKNFSWLVLSTIAKMVGGTVQFISDEECLIVDPGGTTMAHFFGMTHIVVEGKTLERALMHSVIQIAVFIRGEK